MILYQKKSNNSLHCHFLKLSIKIPTHERKRGINRFTCDGEVGGKNAEQLAAEEGQEG